MDMYRQGYLLLDIIDTMVIDYLIGNADRHMYETISNFPDTETMLLLLDNGKRYCYTMKSGYIMVHRVHNKAK